MPALVVLLLFQLQLQRLPLAALAVERIVIAAVVDELALVEMDDAVDGGVEEIAVVADEQHAPRIAGEIALEPHGAFEVEVVGRLVEQQQVGLGEKHGRQRHAHPPAAGEGGAGAALRRFAEPESGQDRCRPRFGRVRVDIGEAGLDLRDPIGIGCGLRLGEQGGALGVGGEHHLDQRLRTGRCFLRHLTDAGVPRQAHRAAFGLDLAHDQTEQGRLAAAVPADEPGPRSFGQGDGGPVEKHPVADPVGDVVDVEHDAGGFALSRDPAQGRIDKPFTVFLRCGE